MQLPLNVSPVSASFIGLQRLGIHLVLCLACLATVQQHTRSLARGIPATSSLARSLAHTHVQAPLSLSVLGLSALGKIEVIILYSVVNVLPLLNARV
jgi:hypothetical protein